MSHPKGFFGSSSMKRAKVLECTHSIVLWLWDFSKSHPWCWFSAEFYKVALLVKTSLFTLASPFASHCLTLSLSLLPFPNLICITAKQSNECMHISEPCCPTLFHVQAKSVAMQSAAWQPTRRARKKKKTISPATNNHLDSDTSILLTSQIECIIYIKKVRAFPVGGFQIV